MKSGEVVDRPDAAMSFEELNEVMGMKHIQSLEMRFLTDAQKKSKYGDEHIAPVNLNGNK